MPRNKFKFDDVIDAAKRVSKKARYPINGFDDLAKALGGENADIKFEGKEYKVSHVRRLVTVDYFPIESEEDLIAKAAHLRGGGGGPDTDDVKWANPVDKPEGGKETPPNIPVNEKPRSRGVPAVKGYQKT
jgi:hypothetical protein